MKYLWDNYSGVVDENGKQVCQLLDTYPRRLREVLGKILVDELNRLGFELGAVK